MAQIHFKNDFMCTSRIILYQTISPRSIRGIPLKNPPLIRILYLIRGGDSYAGGDCYAVLFLYIKFWKKNEIWLLSKIFKKMKFNVLSKISKKNEIRFFSKISKIRFFLLLKFPFFNTYMFEIQSETVFFMLLWTFFLLVFYLFSTVFGVSPQKKFGIFFEIHFF